MIYGAIVFLPQVMEAHPSEATFQKFGFVVLYHVSFFIFITTIGLNIIFGIIVDTFSELRDLKVGMNCIIFIKTIELNIILGIIDMLSKLQKVTFGNSKGIVDSLLSTYTMFKHSELLSGKSRL
jgi:hypothetical protein